MAGRSRTTFQKRQKEMKRQEKQRMKADRRAQRNLAKREGEIPNENENQNENVTVPVESEAQEPQD